MKALYVTKPKSMDEADWNVLEEKVVAVIKLCLVDDVMYHVMDEESQWQFG